MDIISSIPKHGIRVSRPVPFIIQPGTALCEQERKSSSQRGKDHRRMVGLKKQQGAKIYNSLAIHEYRGAFQSHKQRIASWDSLRTL